MSDSLEYREMKYQGATEPIKAALFLLHGVAANEQSVLHLASTVDAGFDVLSLRAPVVLGPASFAWFAGRFTGLGPEIDAVSAERSRIALLNFINGYRGKHPSRPVFLMGFSQGATLSLIAALTAPADVQGAVCFSGRFPDEFRNRIAPMDKLQHTQLWIGNGLSDTVLPISYGRATRDLLHDKGVRDEYVEFAGAHEVPEASHQLACKWLDYIATDQSNHSRPSVE